MFFSSYVNLYIPKLWINESLNLLSQKGSAVRILKKEFSRPKRLPSRVFRNILELTGQIIRSHIKRKELFEKFLKGKDILNYSLLQVLNVRRQIENLEKKTKAKFLL